jgi:hypothetical protein
MKPSIGRIVGFYSQDPSKALGDLTCSPAIIISVGIAEEYLASNIETRKVTSGDVVLAIFGYSTLSRQMQHPSKVSFSPTPRHDHWSWLPKVSE